MSDNPPFYILIRTSKRPKFFAKMMTSIKAQTYSNIITIVHTDDQNDTYIQGDIIIKGERKYPTKEHKAPYNLYNNTLLQSIPEGAGWYMFIDDDDIYTAPDVIEKALQYCKEDFINVTRVIRWNHQIYPRNWHSCKSFQTECFILHTKHKGIALWWDHQGGDHYYSRQIIEKLKINWIDGVILCQAQEGKGHGHRFDLGEASPERLKNGLPEMDRTLVPVLFKIGIRFPQECKGYEGEVKNIPLWRAKGFEQQQRIIINPTPENIKEVREQLKHRPPLSENKYKYLYKKNK